MAKGDKDARSLQREYGVAYQECLWLVREKGVEGAIEELDQRREIARLLATEPRFHVVIRECVLQKEFVENIDRLYGTNLARRGTGLQLAIDDASGRMQKDIRTFIRFVKEQVWDRLPEVRT